MSDNVIKHAFAKSFRDLTVYQKAYAVSLEIHRASIGFPQPEQYALADQIRRSTKSICANIAEGFGRQRASKAEFKRFVSLAIGSCDETCVWLDYCRDLGYLSHAHYGQYSTEYESISRMLYALRNSS